MDITVLIKVSLKEQKVGQIWSASHNLEIPAQGFILLQLCNGGLWSNDRKLLPLTGCLPCVHHLRLEMLSFLRKKICILLPRKKKKFVGKASSRICYNINGDLIKRKRDSNAQMKRLTIKKMSLFFNFIYHFHAILIKIPVHFLMECNQLNLIFIKKNKELRIA